MLIVRIEGVGCLKLRVQGLELKVLALSRGLGGLYRGLGLGFGVLSGSLHWGLLIYRPQSLCRLEAFSVWRYCNVR